MMSVSNKKEEFNQSTSDSKCAKITIGSHYALQVALQTMKERCQQLQQRLLSVEGENLNLRVEIDAFKNTKSTNGDTDVKGATDDLRQQVTQLTRQKSQLTHHIFMVANENKQLWNRLSRLTQANQSLGNHLTKISDTLNQHPSGSVSGASKSSVNKNPGEVSPKECSSPSSDSKTSTASSDDAKETAKKNSFDLEGEKEESLEEISLKLIKSFLQEKTELEQQYAQMVQIQTDCPSFSVPDLGFTYEEEGDESIVDEVKLHGEKLQSMQEALKEQHNVLKSAVCKLESMKNGGLLCTLCKDRTKSKVPLEKTTQAEVVEMESLCMWGSSGTHSYNEVIQRQLKQVAEPPTIPRRLTERSSSFNTTTTSMPAWQHPYEAESTPPKDRMCPLCSNIYPKDKSFKEFHDHVMNHFASEDESDSIIDNFEIITDVGTQ